MSTRVHSMWIHLNYMKDIIDLLVSHSDFTTRAAAFWTSALKPHNTIPIP